MCARHRWSLPGFAKGCAMLLLLAIGSSCGSSDSGPDFGTNNPEVIVAMGDSITFGYGDIGVDSCDESQRGVGGFCPRLQGLIDKPVINEGDCGSQSSDGAARVQSVLQSYRPGVLLIDYSPNDLFEGTEVAIDNLRTMIGAAISNKTVPVVGTLVPSAGEHTGWGPFIKALNNDIRSLCKELKVECADHYEAFVSDPGFAVSPYALLSEDGLHPNASGYELMAKTWHSALRKVY